MQDGAVKWYDKIPAKTKWYDSIPPKNQDGNIKAFGGTKEAPLQMPEQVISGNSNDARPLADIPLTDTQRKIGENIPQPESLATQNPSAQAFYDAKHIINQTDELIKTADDFVSGKGLAGILNPPMNVAQGIYGGLKKGYELAQETGQQVRTDLIQGDPELAKLDLISGVAGASARTAFSGATAVFPALQAFSYGTDVLSKTLPSGLPQTALQYATQPVTSIVKPETFLGKTLSELGDVVVQGLVLKGIGAVRGARAVSEYAKQNGFSDVQEMATSMGFKDEGQLNTAVNLTTKIKETDAAIEIAKATKNKADFERLTKKRDNLSKLADTVIPQQPEIAKQNEVQNAPIERNIPESSKPEYSGVNQSGLPEKTSGGDSVQPRQEIPQAEAQVKFPTKEEYNNLYKNTPIASEEQILDIIKQNAPDSVYLKYLQGRLEQVPEDAGTVFDIEAKYMYDAGFTYNQKTMQWGLLPKELTDLWDKYGKIPYDEIAKKVQDQPQTETQVDNNVNAIRQSTEQGKSPEDIAKVEPTPDQATDVPLKTTNVMKSSDVEFERIKQNWAKETGENEVLTMNRDKFAEFTGVEDFNKETGIPEKPIAPPTTDRGQLELQSQILPVTSIVDAGKEFYKQDIQPTLQNSVGGIAKGFDSIKKIFAPTSRGVEAETAARIITTENAKLAYKKELAYRSLGEANKAFDNQDVNKNLDFYNKIETGNTSDLSPNEKMFALEMRGLLDNTWKQVTDRTGSDAYIENYLPHIYENPEQAKSILANYYSKRPLEGSKSFLKQRTLPTLKEAMDLGLKPLSTNPVDMVMMQLHNENKFIMGHDIWQQFKEQGLTKFVRFGDKAPDGYVKVNDKIAKVYQYSEAEKGFISRGEYYMPEKAGTVLNNFLAPGLSGKVGYELLRKSGNILNQVQLGLSGFHAMFTAGDAVTSKVALGIMQLTQKGNKLQGLGNIAKGIPGASIYTSLENVIRGNKLLKDLYKASPENAQILNNFLESGSRLRMDSFYKNSAIAGFMKALKSGNPVGAAIRTPGALIEAIAKPLMQELVPRQKLGVLADLMQNIENEAFKNNWTNEVKTQRLQEAAKSVDNRMGQLVYDNLFWNKTLKDLGMASVRSLGWNVGDVRELGGGVLDFASQGKNLLTGKDARITPRMAYTIALPFVVGMHGAVIYYLYNGEAPKELKDYFFPKTGETAEDGTDERISLPSYMKDVYAVSQNPLLTASHKMHPMISTVLNMLDNQDYFGYEIRNPEDPLVKQLGQEFNYMAQQFLPFSVKNYQQMIKTGESGGQAAQSFFGITPAPKYISRTSIQNEIDAKYKEQFGGGIKPYSQKEIDEKKREIRRLIGAGQKEEANQILRDMRDRNEITKKSAKLLVKGNGVGADVYKFRRLSQFTKDYLTSRMTDEEKQKYLTKKKTTIYR